MLGQFRFLATGESFQNLSYDWHINANAISGFVDQTADFLIEALLPVHGMPPDTEEKWIYESQLAYELWNWPNGLGAIDGKHVAMKCPPRSGSQNHNYKGFFSIILLAVVSATYKFLLFDVGEYGRVR